ncbi:MAG TPA: hypothetical protein VFB54_00820 [Burkholderiales bacterium]|nr:hypothetical protein [Burkholderiales bacterium]
MLDQLFVNPPALALLAYLRTPETWTAVLLPGTVSLAIFGAYLHAGRISAQLQRIWWCALPISYGCAYWVITPEAESLYIFSAFSVACAFLLFRRRSVPPALAFALTFLSLFSVDMSHALARAITVGLPLDRFYLGVGGAGLRDSLLVMPSLTAMTVAYARLRIRRRGEELVDF